MAAKHDEARLLYKDALDISRRRILPVLILGYRLLLSLGRVNGVFSRRPWLEYVLCRSNSNPVMKCERKGREQRQENDSARLFRSAHPCTVLKEESCPHMEARRNRGAAKRTYAEDSDSGSDHSEDEVVRPSQGRVQKRRRANDGLTDHTGVQEDEVNGDKYQHEAGHIISVYMENFMCHRKFFAAFGHHVQFIAGRNGSGKSAIVAAIQLCLGSSARHTGRGSNIGKYVREGSENPAILKVTLLNKGPDAYKHNLYGDKITVKRVISKGGTSTYHLLDYNGQEVSRHKTDLDSMLRTFNIFVDTPCCILTQEESKRLIHGSAREKYEFFLKATGLRMIYEELQQATKMVEEAQGRLQTLMPTIDSARQHRNECKQRVDEFLELDHFQARIRQETAKLYWYDVRVEEGVVRDFEERLQDKQEEVERAKEKLENTSLAELESQLHDLEFKIDELNAAKGPVEEAYEAKHNALRGLQHSESQLRNHQRAMVTKKKEYNDRLKVVNGMIAEAKEKAMRDAGKEERAVMARIQQHQAEMARLTEENTNIERNKRQVQEEVTRLVQQTSAITSQLSNRDRRCGAIQRELHSIESGQGNATKFGDHVPAILSQVARTQFRGPVVGPIGTCVAIRDGCDKWSHALEQALFNQLKSFVVTTVEDRNTLYGILRRVGHGAANWHPIILQHNGPRMAADKLDKPDQYPTIAEVLQVNDDLAFNALLDQVQIDRVGLADTEGVILHELKEHVNGQDRLRYGFARVVTRNAVTVSYRMGNQSSETPFGPHRHMLAKDMTVYATTLRAELEQLKQEMNECTADLRGINERKNAGDAEIRRCDGSYLANSNAIRNHARRKAEADNELLEVQESGRIDTSDLEREQQELHEAIDTVAAEMDRKQQELDTLVEQVRHAKAEETAAAMRKREVGIEVDNVQNAFDRVVNRRDDAMKRKGALQAAHDRAVREMEDCEAQTNRQIAHCKGKVALAEEKTRDLIEDWDGKPVPLTDRETTHSIERKITKLRADWEEGMRKVNLAGYTQEILIERYEIANTAYLTLKKNVKEAQQNTNQVTHYKDELVTKWEQSYNNALAKTNSAFQHYANRQGAAGKVVIDPVKEEMSLVVAMDASDPKSQQTDVRNLSGGERSYVTLCLLLALGHVTESPFRLLDEYDVFMDEARRADTLNAIQAHALRPEQLGRQMIIITPNSLASVKTTNQVRVFRMPDPQRQSAHGLQQQTLD